MFLWYNNNSIVNISFCSTIRSLLSLLRNNSKNIYWALYSPLNAVVHWRRVLAKFSVVCGTFLPLMFHCFILSIDAWLTHIFTQLFTQLFHVSLASHCSMMNLSIHQKVRNKITRGRRFFCGQKSTTSPTKSEEQSPLSFKYLTTVLVLAKTWCSFFFDVIYGVYHLFCATSHNLNRSRFFPALEKYWALLKVILTRLYSYWFLSIVHML